MGLMDDAKRAARRSADLAEMSDAKRIERLRAELATERKDFLDLVEQSAKDKLALAKANARIAELENKNSYNLQIVREATARIAALEAAGNRLSDAAITGILDGNDFRARAERAEAELEAMREALRKIEQETIDHVAVRIARAARAPSPAEREG